MPEEVGFRFLRGARDFLFSAASRLILRVSHPPIQWVLVAISLRVKQSGHEIDPSYLLSAEVKNA
jgi:hypothetical protein